MPRERRRSSAGGLMAPIHIRKAPVHIRKGRAAGAGLRLREEPIRGKGQWEEPVGGRRSSSDRGAGFGGRAGPRKGAPERADAGGIACAADGGRFRPPRECALVRTDRGVHRLPRRR